MPIPFIVGALGLLAAGTGALGIGKGIKAGIDIKDAKDTNEYAKDIIDDENDRLAICRENSNDAIVGLGKKKLCVLENSVMPFITSFERIKNIELKDSEGLDEMSNMALDEDEMKELKELGVSVSSIAGGVAGAAVGGALAAFGAYGAATTFATASTGTAIATLSGAAATNATLAFLGGGSLAAGGLGMAGGTAILGGLVAGPALAIMGVIVGAKAKANKDEAYANLAKAKEFRETANAVKSACKGIRLRANMFERLLVKLDYIFMPLTYRLNEIIETKGTDYSKYEQDEKNVVAGCLTLAKAIKTVLDTPILDENGKVTAKSLKIANDTKKLAENFE